MGFELTRATWIIFSTFGYLCGFNTYYTSTGRSIRMMSGSSLCFVDVVGLQEVASSVTLGALWHFICGLRCRSLHHHETQSSQSLTLEATSCSAMIAEQGSGPLLKIVSLPPIGLDHQKIHMRASHLFS